MDINATTGTQIQDRLRLRSELLKRIIQSEIRRRPKNETTQMRTPISRISDSDKMRH